MDISRSNKGKIIVGLVVLNLVTLVIALIGVTLGGRKGILVKQARPVLRECRATSVRKGRSEITGRKVKPVPKDRWERQVLAARRATLVRKVETEKGAHKARKAMSVLEAPHAEQVLRERRALLGRKVRRATQVPAIPRASWC